MKANRKIRFVPILNQTLAFLLFFVAESSCADGVDGILEERSLGTLNLNLQVTESGIFIINPGTPMAMRPEFILERRPQTTGAQGRPGFAICIVGRDSSQLQVDTLFINEKGMLQQTPDGVQVPFFISVGLENNFAKRARVRVVDSTKCSNRNALNIVAIEPVATRAQQSVPPITNFRLLIQAE